MEFDAFIGIIVIVVALAANAALVLWSKHTIRVIDERNLTSARNIKKELKKKSKEND